MTNMREAGVVAPRPSPERIAEANPRVANELGHLSALAKRQIDRAAGGPDSLSRQSVVDMLRLHHGRLLGIARLHHALSRTPGSDHVDLAQVLADLVREFEASGVFEDRLRLTSVFAANCRIDASRASAITLAFSEIATNALKYAHPTRDAGVGLKLVRSLIEGVSGALTISSSPLGLTFHIELPRRDDKDGTSSPWRNE